MQYDTILIKDLTLSMSIGVFDHEKTAKQRVIVDVEMLIEAGGYDDNDLGSTVCYDTITKKIIALSQSRHYNLVETFAEEIAALCLENKRVQKVAVMAEKPDIMDGGTRVGVRIERT